MGHVIRMVQREVSKKNDRRQEVNKNVEEHV
jgi:hypothetical protein